LQSKLPQVGTTIFTVMSNLAREYDAINLSQGFPDYPISSKLISYVNEAMLAGFNQYAPMPGLPELRTVLANKIERLYQAKMNPDSEITITPGATYAIYCAFTAILQPCDEVIVLEPAYDSYIPNIHLNGAKAICVPLQYPDYSVNWQKVKEAISPNTKALIINTPHNPTGYVWTANDMKQLDALTANTDIIILSDEVYEHITLDERTHESVLKYEGLRNRSLVLFSFGKVFHATGWKIGYCVAPERLMKEFRKVHQFVGFTTNTPMQYALAKLMEDENEYLQLPHFFEKKRDLFLELLSDLPFTIHQKSQGSYFQLAGYEKINKMGDKDFATWLTKEIGVATIPVSAFNQDGRDDKLIRFCFAKMDRTLIGAADRMKKLLTL
jgi:methionine aminotransferase